jgi:hypothetical protein
MRLIAVDKVQHVAVGAIIVLFVSAMAAASALVKHLDPMAYVIFASNLGAVLASAAAVAKEDADRKNPENHTYDGWDAYATAVGAVWMNFVISATLLFIK